MWRDVARCGEMWRDVAKCGEMWREWTWIGTTGIMWQRVRVQRTAVVCGHTLIWQRESEFNGRRCVRLPAADRRGVAAARHKQQAPHVVRHLISDNLGT